MQLSGSQIQFDWLIEKEINRLIDPYNNVQLLPNDRV